MKTNKTIDWEQRTYEIAKEIYPYFIEAAMSGEDNFFRTWVRENDKDITTEPALFALKYAETLSCMLMAQNDMDKNPEDAPW